MTWAQLQWAAVLGLAGVALYYASVGVAEASEGRSDKVTERWCEGFLIRSQDGWCVEDTCSVVCAPHSPSYSVLQCGFCDPAPGQRIQDKFGNPVDEAPYYIAELDGWYIGWPPQPATIIDRKMPPEARYGWSVVQQLFGGMIGMGG